MSRSVKTKSPVECEEFSVTYADRLSGTGDSIASSEWEVPDELTIEAESNTDVLTVIQLSGGVVADTEETNFVIRNTVTDTNDPPRIYETVFELKIIEK